MACECYGCQDDLDHERRMKHEARRETGLAKAEIGYLTKELADARRELAELDEFLGQNWTLVGAGKATLLERVTELALELQRTTCALRDAEFDSAKLQQSALQIARESLDGAPCWCPGVGLSGVHSPACRLLRSTVAGAQGKSSMNKGGK